MVFSAGTQQDPAYLDQILILPRYGLLAVADEVLVWGASSLHLPFTPAIHTFSSQVLMWGAKPQPTPAWLPGGSLFADGPSLAPRGWLRGPASPGALSFWDGGAAEQVHVFTFSYAAAHCCCVPAGHPGGMSWPSNLDASTAPRKFR